MGLPPDSRSRIRLPGSHGNWESQVLVYFRPFSLSMRSYLVCVLTRLMRRCGIWQESTTQMYSASILLTGITVEKVWSFSTNLPFLFVLLCFPSASLHFSPWINFVTCGEELDLKPQVAGTPNSMRHLFRGSVNGSSNVDGCISQFSGKWVLPFEFLFASVSFLRHQARLVLLDISCRCWTHKAGEGYVGFGTIGRALHGNKFHFFFN